MFPLMLTNFENPRPAFKNVEAFFSCPTKGKPNEKQTTNRGGLQVV